MVRCQEVQQKLSRLSQRLRALLNVCNVYSNRLAKYLSRINRGSLKEENEDLEEEEEEEGAVADEGQVLPVLSDEVCYLMLALHTLV